jgi:CHASE3 domain sensor protein
LSTARDDLKARIEAIESGYEYFLAYAAQGLSSDQGSKSSAALRDFLRKMEKALDGLVDPFKAVVADEGLEPQGAWEDLLRVVETDAAATLAAIRLVSARSGISSQIIDNLNANIHLRALLTDLFLVDDLIEPR